MLGIYEMIHSLSIGDKKCHCNLTYIPFAQLSGYLLMAVLLIEPSIHSDARPVHSMGKSGGSTEVVSEYT
jgi:hypothetical protein